MYTFARLVINPHVLFQGEMQVIFSLGTGDNHLVRGKDESNCLRVTDTHDDCSEMVSDFKRLHPAP